MSCKYAEVASFLERTNPQHPPSFYNALEVVKRYARAKIASGKCRVLAGRGGKLEDLEQRFAHLGFQDVFYLTRLHLRLPPSTLDLPNPSCPVRKTLLRAGYPLPTQSECSNGPSSSSSRTTNVISRPTSPKSSIPRRGSSSLDLSVPSESRSRLDGAPTKASPATGMKRSTSSPYLTLSPPAHSSNSSRSSPISPTLSMKSHGSGSSRWTPLLSGLGIKLYHDPHLYDTCPPNPRVPFMLDPFAASLPSPDDSKSCNASLHLDQSRVATLEVVITRADIASDEVSNRERERGFSLLEALGETEKDLEKFCMAQSGSPTIHQNCV
ncbi:hypothetical protein IAT40_005081 [Kwoniella sp. CBS 6097]